MIPSGVSSGKSSPLTSIRNILPSRLFVMSWALPFVAVWPARRRRRHASAVAGWRCRGREPWESFRTEAYPTAVVVRLRLRESASADDVGVGFATFEVAGSPETIYSRIYGYQTERGFRGVIVRRYVHVKLALPGLFVSVLK